jgi:Tetracyclin repressor-like, C-terminal domain
VGAIATHPALLDLYQQASMGTRFQRLYHLVEQVRSRGQIRHEVSNELAAEMIAGPLFYHIVLI